MHIQPARLRTRPGCSLRLRCVRSLSGDFRLDKSHSLDDVDDSVFSELSEFRRVNQSECVCPAQAATEGWSYEFSLGPLEPKDYSTASSKRSYRVNHRLFPVRQPPEAGPVVPASLAKYTRVSLPDRSPIQNQKTSYFVVVSVGHSHV